MRLEQYLSEKVNINYKLKATNTYDSGDVYEIEFDVGGRGYTFRAEQFDLAYEHKKLKQFLGAPDYKGKTTIWDLEFAQDEQPSNKTRHSITGTAGTQAVEVFSALAVATKQFALVKRPDFMTFSAKEKSRIRIYDRLAKMIPKVRTTSGSYEFLGTVAIGDKVYVFKRGGAELEDDE
jgi:hypothetical protein